MTDLRPRKGTNDEWVNTNLSKWTENARTICRTLVIQHFRYIGIIRSPVPLIRHAIV